MMSVVTLVVVGLFALGLAVFARVDGTVGKDSSWQPPGGKPPAEVACLNEIFIEVLAGKLGISADELQNLFNKKTDNASDPKAALEAIAAQLGLSAEELKKLTDTAREEALDQAVAAGCLTEEQAQHMKEHQGQQEPPRQEPPGAACLHEAFIEVLAGRLGISADELQGFFAERKDGTSDPKAALEALATRLGLSIDELRNLMDQAREEALDQAVASGCLTEEQAQHMKERQGQRGTPPNATPPASARKLPSASTRAYVSTNTARFVAQGQGVAEIKVGIYDLRGRLVYDSGFVAGNELSWHLGNNDGERVANGVYLYVATIRGSAGEVTSSGIQKLVILRK